MSGSNIRNVEYTFGDFIYNVCETEEVHMKLQSDTEYLNAYFANCATSPELVSVIPETETTQKGSAGSSKFKWSERSTKFFLKCYLDKKEQFRDPKIKKKVLWQAMLEQMQSAGFQVEEEETLDRKMRNMRKTYKTLRDNNKKSSTGRGRVSWEHFDIFEEIFSNDQTVNCSHTVASMTSHEEEPTTSSRAQHVLHAASTQHQIPTETNNEEQQATSPQNLTSNQTNNQQQQASSQQHQTPTQQTPTRLRNQRQRMTSLQNMRKTFLAIES